MNVEWISAPVSPLSEATTLEAQARQALLTKPPGSLGRLEELSIQLAAMQHTSRPQLNRVHISVFAADHGVAEEGISAFPQSVTTEMINNFVRGGAAISVLAQTLNASLEVINLGTVSDSDVPGVMNRRIGPGSANFTIEPAMTPEQLVDALDIGRQVAVAAAGNGCELFIGGDMGIGNTTTATALACALLPAPVEDLVGPGTGLNADGITHKADVIRRALARHRASLNNPLEILRCLGGFEIAALAGAYIACAQAGIPVLVDGFITGVASLVASALCPDTRDWLLFSHTSAEPGHSRVLQALHAKPLIDLGMRLGEGSGAAVAVPLLRLACDLYNRMATFDTAGVSTKIR